MRSGSREAARPTTRPVHGASDKFQHDPHWKDLILFFEYFHGDTGSGVGASHQTGWTGLVAKLLQQSGEREEERSQDRSDVSELEAMLSGD